MEEEVERERAEEEEVCEQPPHLHPDEDEAQVEVEREGRDELERAGGGREHRAGEVDACDERDLKVPAWRNVDLGMGPHDTGEASCESGRPTPTGTPGQRPRPRTRARLAHGCTAWQKGLAAPTVAAHPRAERANPAGSSSRGEVAAKPTAEQRCANKPWLDSSVLTLAFASCGDLFQSGLKAPNLPQLEMFKHRP